MIFASIIFIILTIFIPINIIFFWNKKINIKLIILGILTFVVSQDIIRIPILDIIYNNLSFQLYYSQYTIFLGIFISLSAGICEVSADFISLKFFFHNIKFNQAITIGVFHAIAETIQLVGVPILIIFIMNKSISPLQIYINTFERLFATILHIACALFAYYSIRKSNKLYLLYGILIHSLDDFMVFIFVNTYLLQASCAIISIISFLFILNKINKNELVDFI